MVTTSADEATPRTVGAADVAALRAAVRGELDRDAEAQPRRRRNPLATPLRAAHAGGV
jgi:hypothetical protein